MLRAGMSISTAPSRFRPGALIRTPQILPSYLPPARCGEEYDGPVFELTDVDNADDYTLMASRDGDFGEFANPPGLVMTSFDGSSRRHTSKCKFTGIPQEAGIFSFSILAGRPGEPDEIERAYELAVAPGPITFPEELVDAVVGRAYNQIFKALGEILLEGEWSISDGQLPPDFEFNKDGSLVASPTGGNSQPGDYSFEVTFTLNEDPTLSSKRTYTLTVLPEDSTLVAAAKQMLSNKPLYGKLVVVSGAIPGYNRTQALWALSHQAGATVKDSASDVSTADALLVSGLTSKKLAQGGGVSKTKAAQRYKIPIIQIDTKSDFEDILSGRRPI